MDLAEFASEYTKAQETGKKVKIINPENGKPVGLTFIVAGPDSQKQQLAYRRMVEKRVSAGLTREMTDDERTEEVISYMYDCLISWEWDEGATWRGQENPEFNEENVRDVLRSARFIRNQLDRDASSPTGFIKS